MPPSPLGPGRSSCDHDHEQTPLLTQQSSNQSGIDNENVPDEPRGELPSSLVRRLYTSHLLSTWNSRVFEFGAVLYLAAIYPGTLLPMSIYALTRGLSTIVFAPSVGLYIDNGNRMQVVRVSIVGQRVAVAVSCTVFYLLSVQIPPGEQVKDAMLALLAFLSCIEKLCSILNFVAVEKDWTVVVASGNQDLLSTLNAQMRRIDLVCKMIGPLFIALVDGYSTQLAILVNLGMNLASVIVEYFAIAQVYHRVPELQHPKGARSEPTWIGAGSDTQAPSPDPQQEDRSAHRWHHVKGVLRRTVWDFKLYFRHDVFLPSFAGALLYLTVLSFSGQMVTYLLATGYQSTQIGIARTLSVVFEILATWAAPWLIARIGPVRAGLWLSTSQVTMLAAGTAVFFVFAERPLVSASGLVGGTILSRLGLRGFDLCAQILNVEAEARGAFSSVEAGWQNAFELLSYASTIVFSRPDQFKWPTLISTMAVATACAIYANYVMRQRGHLLHLDALCSMGAMKRAAGGDHSGVC